MDLSLFQKITSDDFAVTSLGQYAKTKRIAYQKAMDVIQQCTAADNLEEVESILNMVEGIDVNSTLIIGQSSDSLANIAKAAFALSEKYAGTEDQAPTGDYNTEVALQHGSISLAQLGDTMQADLNSIACLEAACDVFPMQDPNTQLSFFKDKLADTFSQNFTAVSSSYQQYRSFFEKKLNASQFLNSITSMMGLNDVNDDDDDDDTTLSVVGNSDFNRFTGASPAGPLSFDTVNNAVSSAATVAVKAIGGVMKGLVKCATSLFNKVKTKVVQTVSDPDDLYEVEGEAPYCSNFGYCINRDITLRIPLIDGVNVNQLILALTGQENKWIYVDTIFFTAQYRYSNGAFIGDNGQFTAHFEAIIKPKIIGSNLKLALNNYWELDNPSEGGWYPKNGSITQSTLSLLEDLSSNTMYADNQTDEKTKAAGLCDALTVGSSVLENIIDIISGTVHEEEGVGILTYSQQLPSTVTNAIFFYLATGIAGNDSNATFESAGFNSSGGMRAATFAERILKDLFTGFVFHRVDKLLHPNDYQWFPYADEYQPLPGKWDIKTDAENREAFNTFGTTLVIAIVAVVATVVIGVAAKKITRALFFKRKSIIGTLDNKMWSGGTLTSKERRQYLRASRKLDASSVLSSGLAATTNIDVSTSNTSSLIESMTHLTGLIS